ncbi:hypothetical protein ACFFX0_19080 [Citricoccus parietis]|uniref:Uncharacterized protein n=1 Tax=Citricoccus parietis TaxID=592307 RepID=A0ABV5G2M5_9MICC
MSTPRAGPISSAVTGLPNAAATELTMSMMAVKATTMVVARTDGRGQNGVCRVFGVVDAGGWAGLGVGVGMVGCMGAPSSALLPCERHATQN